MRWRKDNRQQPDDSPDLPAEEWLSQFRPVRPDALTSADRDAVAQPAGQAAPARGWRDRPNVPAQTVDDPRDPRDERPDRGRGGSDGRQGRNDDSWARADARRAGGSLERAARGPDSVTDAPQSARPGTSSSRETVRRAAPGWETGSSQFAPGWETDAGQHSPRWETNSRQQATGSAQRPDPNGRDNGHRTAGPLDDTPSQRPAGDVNRPAAESYRPAAERYRSAADRDRPVADGQRTLSDGWRSRAMDRQGQHESGDRNSQAAGPDPRRSAHGDRRVSDSYLAGPDSPYQSRDARGYSDELASDVDPRRPARDGRPGGRDPVRDLHRPADGNGGSAGGRDSWRPGYGNGGGSASSRDSSRSDYGSGGGSAGGRDPWRASHGGGEEREGNRHGRPSPETGAAEFRQSARAPAGAGEFRRSVPTKAPGRDEFRPERPGFELGGDQYLRDRQDSAPERGAQRPEPGRSPADRGGFRTDWEVLRAVRDGLRADVDAVRSADAGTQRRDGIRPDPSLRDAGYGRPETVSGSRAPDRESSPRQSEVPQDRAYETSGPAPNGRVGGESTGARSVPVPSVSHTLDAPGSLDDDTLTRPLPVILPGATALPRPGPIEAPRGPFEPARPSLPQPRPASITGSVEPPAETFAASAPVPTAPPLRPIPEAAAAKLDQIKDLYLTAEAIGEDALDKHFDQVSQRQRELIREFFQRSGPGTDGRPPT